MSDDTQSGQERSQLRVKRHRLYKSLGGERGVWLECAGSGTETRAGDFEWWMVDYLMSRSLDPGDPDHRTAEAIRCILKEAEDGE